MSSSAADKTRRRQRAELIQSWALDPSAAPFDSGWMALAAPARFTPIARQSLTQRSRSGPRASAAPLGPDPSLCFERSIVDSDTISAMLSARAQGERPCGLVFCSAKRPGGGWDNGARAQEEDISLASLWAIQAQEAPGFYAASEGLNALNADALISAPSSLILFDAQGELLDQPEPCSFIGFAAPNAKGLASQGINPEQGAWPGAIESALLTRAKAALDLAVEMGSPTLILGAIGCGVFGLSADLVARCWKRALDEARYAGPVRFAIPDARGPIGSVFASVLNLSEKAPTQESIGAAARVKL